MKGILFKAVFWGVIILFVWWLQKRKRKENGQDSKYIDDMNNHKIYTNRMIERLRKPKR